MLCGDARAQVLLVQPVDEHDLALIDAEVAEIRALTDVPFMLACVKIDDWQSELTPWAAPAVFGKEPFGDKAASTLAYITKTLLPMLAVGGDIKRYYLGGYSLAGLFALWAGYQVDIFSGVAAVSPSVWYDGWTDYAELHNPHAMAEYLSLGDREEMTKNKVMSRVGTAIRRQHELLVGADVLTTLEWNQGNHFADSDKRTAKGLAWLINNQR